jgi:hypothetical protein
LLLLLLELLLLLQVAKLLSLLLGLQLLPVWILVLLLLLLGLLLLLLHFFSSTKPLSCVFAFSSPRVRRSFALIVLRKHARRTGAGEVDALVACTRFKTSLAQVPVAMHSRYCARRRAAAGPKAGNGGKAAPMLCIYLC